MNPRLAALLLILPLAACTGEGPAGTPEPAPSPVQSQEDSWDCVRPDATLAETGLYDHARTVRLTLGGEGGEEVDLETLPTDTGDTVYFFSVREDHFDPCLPLSWVILAGDNGDEIGPRGLAASQAEVPVFFHFDRVITDPAPAEETRVMESRRLDDSTVEITHGYTTRSTAEGVTETPVLQHAWRDGHLLVEGPDAARYRELSDGHVKLDLG